MTDVTVVSAPGKLMIAGEYAVLRSAPALVAAVDRRLVLTCRPNERGELQTPPDREEVGATYALARKRYSTPPVSISVDAEALYHPQSGIKLGLGSSAAAAAATAGAMRALSGQEVGTALARQELFPIAMEGHRSVAPQGSGADVAASVLGGFVRFQRTGDEVSAEPIAFPASVHARVVWTGQPARTSDFVSRVDALAKAEPQVATTRIDAIAAASENMLSVLERGLKSASDHEELLAATRAHHDAMAALGDAARIPIIEARLQKVAELAKEAGGAAKPSGAGGGDVALVLFYERTALSWWSKACEKHGLTLLSLCLGAEGVREDRPRGSPR